MMERINKSLIFFAGILMLILTGLANLQVLYRFVLELPLPWVEEVIRYILIYLVLIMSSTAIYYNSHLNVDILDLILKGKYLTFLRKFRTTIVLVFIVCYGYLAVRFLGDTISLGQVTPALQISMAWPLLAILVGSILMAINCIYLIFTKEMGDTKYSDISEGE